MRLPLSDRDRRILGAVVEEFTQTAEPVGSRCLTERYGLGVSPATVRNVMAELEEMGYLVQPHTSAGRKPTDKAYRYYVDHIMETPAICVADRRRLAQRIGESRGRDVGELLGTASRALSRTAQQVGVVAGPRFRSAIFRHIDFVLLRPGKVLVVLVYRSGVLQHRPVDAPEIASQDELDRMANYLNGLLEDLPLSEVRDRILREMNTERALYDTLLSRALALGSEAFSQEEPIGEVFVSDPGSLLDYPEFTDVERMRSIFDAFEKKSLILKLLERAFDAPGIQVSIGLETEVSGLQDCAVVSTTYSRAGTKLGSVGVIGPTRMPYQRVVGLVSYTAELLGQVFEDL